MEIALVSKKTGELVQLIDYDIIDLDKIPAWEEVTEDFAE